MPTINNATVATGTGLSTAGNGGRKLVRLTNGWLVAAILNKSTTPHAIKIYVSKNNGLTFEDVCFIQHVTNNFTDLSIVASGTRVMVLSSFNGTVAMYHGLDVLTQTNTNIYTPYLTIDTQTAMGNVSLAINETGMELHAAWSSKNATYPNSFNIRYAKGVINGDGSVTWGAVEQVTTSVTTNANNQSPCIIVFNGNPIIINELSGSGTSTQSIRTQIKSGGSWSFGTNIFSVGSTTLNQSNPCAIFVPQSINGLTNGRLWVAWHGKDATDGIKFNVRVSYSDDGGVTWATPLKLTSGNLYDRQNVSLAADKTGKVFALYEEHQWTPDLDIYMRTFSGGSWGAPVAVAEADPAAESNPSALVDYSLQMTTPPFVFMSGTDGIKFSGNFNVGASVSPASGALGNKETATLTAYTVTPEAGSTVTQIVEKVNGVTVNTFNNLASLSRTLTVPTATWDTLAYFATHTASITVTDSNGATTVTTYSFDKRLATGASLLEATKANTDAKNRISQKRDALAAQVGLSAGSTFDAILGAFGTNVAKKQGGTINSSTSNVGFIDTSGATRFYKAITVTGLGFKPSVITIYDAINNTPVASVNTNNPADSNGFKLILRNSNGSTDGFAIRLTGNAYVSDGGFRLPVVNTTGDIAHNWVAYE